MARSKLTPAAVDRLVELVASGDYTQREIASAVGLSQSRVSVLYSAHKRPRECSWCGATIPATARADKRYCSAVCLGEHARWGHLTEDEMRARFFRERECAKPCCTNPVPLPARPDRKYCDEHVRGRRESQVA